MSINMKDIISIRDIPASWIYKFYCNKYKRPINQPFDGRTIKIHSFWTSDTNASLCIYFDCDAQYYKWRDFSSGKSGDSIQLVKELEGKAYAATVNSIEFSYREFCRNGGIVQDYNVDTFISNIVEIKVVDKQFTRDDLDLMGEWKIGLITLNEYNVRPFSSIAIKKGNVIHNLNNAYGFTFYRANGTPYQIYQPLNAKAKYISVNINDYLIGYDQLKFKSKNCGILSGLKDIMAMKGLGFDSEYVAPKSESTILSIDEISFLKSKYPNLYCILDNDATGLKYMKLYNSIYKIPFIKTGLSKDIAMDRKVYDDVDLRNQYSILINEKINAW